jgi:hypothetical protein
MILPVAFALSLPMPACHGEPDRASLVGRHAIVRHDRRAGSHASAAAEEADELIDALGSQLGVRPGNRVEIVICVNHDAFEREMGSRQAMWIAGLAQPSRGRVVVKQQPESGLRKVVRHEIVHLLVAQALGEAADEAPRWLHEGAAKLYGDDWSAADRDVLAEAAKSDRIDGLDQLAQFPTHPDRAAVAYAESYVLVRYLASLDPQHGLGGLLEAFRETREVPRALRRAYGLSPQEVETGYRAAVAQEVRAAPITWGVEALIFLGMVIVFMVALGRVRRRSREIRERMEEEELLERLFEETARRNASGRS